MIIADLPEKWPVTASERHYEGRIISVTTDTVTMPEGDGALREYVTHPGAVAVVAMAGDRVLLLRQYRHPVRSLLWELPAGLRDKPGEPLAECAARELAEEAGYRAGSWHTLVDLYATPGCSDERVRIFLARDLVAIPEHENSYVRRHEERDMPVEWVPLDEAVKKALSGMIHNSTAIAGILAAYAASDDDYQGLRPADAPEA